MVSRDGGKESSMITGVEDLCKLSMISYGSICSRTPKEVFKGLNNTFEISTAEFLIFHVYLHRRKRSIENDDQPSLSVIGSSAASIFCNIRSPIGFHYYQQSLYM